MHTSTDTDGQAETAAQLIRDAAVALAAAGVSSARLDAEVLLAAARGVDRTALYVRARDRVPRRCREDFRSMLERRLAREPLQYIVRRQEFWSLDFVVTPDVLIPRPETELLVELTLAKCEGEKGPITLCDLGTGSGCIAVALARELPYAHIWALDVSAAALAVAQCNAQRHGVADRVRCVESNLFAAVAARAFDAIVCNPPYVAAAELPHLQPELRWEPRRALDGGAAGLDVIQRVIAAAPKYLRDGGCLLMEIGADQAAAVIDLARAAQLRDVSVRCDLAGLARVLVARR